MSNGLVLKGHEAWREYCENALALELLIQLRKAAQRCTEALISMREPTAPRCRVFDMRAKDIMVTDVISVGADSCLSWIETAGCERCSSAAARLYHVI
jgi:hypothetical protein